MSEGTIRIEVAYALPRRQWLVEIDVPAGTTLGEAIERSGLRQRVPDLEIDPKRVGIFSRLRPLDHVLEAGDRVEVYRPLQADPRDARRQRVAEERAAKR